MLLPHERGVTVLFSRFGSFGSAQCESEPTQLVIQLSQSSVNKNLTLFLANSSRLFRSTTGYVDTIKSIC